MHNRSPQRGQLITGQDIDLPLLIHTSTVRNPEAERLSWHSHDGIELVFLLRGETTYEMVTGPRWVLSGGHFLLVPPRAVHRGAHDIRMPSTLVGLVCNLQCSRPSLAMPLTALELRWLAMRFQTSGAGVYAFSSELDHIIRVLGTEIEAWNAGPKDPLRKAVLRTLACATLLESARQLSGACGEPPGKIVAAAVDYLREHLTEPLQMAELAKHLGLGRARIYELFHKELGLAPHDCLRRLRLEKAQALLNDTDRTITDVAFALGFGSSQHFSRVFRKYVGLTASEYRHRRERENWAAPACSI